MKISQEQNRDHFRRSSNCRKLRFFCSVSQSELVKRRQTIFIKRKIEIQSTALHKTHLWWTSFSKACTSIDICLTFCWIAFNSSWEKLQVPSFVTPIFFTSLWMTPNSSFMVIMFVFWILFSWECKLWRSLQVLQVKLRQVFPLLTPRSTLVNFWQTSSRILSLIEVRSKSVSSWRVNEFQCFEVIDTRSSSIDPKLWPDFADTEWRVEILSLRINFSSWKNSYLSFAYCTTKSVSYFAFKNMINTIT